MTAALAIVVGATLAPQLADPRFGGVFNFIQNFQGYIWPGVVAAFAVGLLVPQTPPAAGVTALVLGPIVYGAFQLFAGSLHFLIQVALTFNVLLLVMGAITFLAPLREPKPLPVRHDLDVRTSPHVRTAGIAVIAATVLFFVVFW